MSLPYGNYTIPGPVDYGYWHAVPTESASRSLDAAVQRSEMPYGYTVPPPPPADSGDFDTRRKETNEQYHIRSKH